MELRVRNVQEAYAAGLRLVRSDGVRENTRNGSALVVQEPVMTIYERPTERVLLDPSRDANPFFHLMESIWMLAGRNDVASLEPFNSGLKNYSDDGEMYHGAYGHRWRRHFGERYTTHSDDGVVHTRPLDQLLRVVELLRANAKDRRVVLSMWDPYADLGREGADFPCNTQVYFRTRTPLPVDVPESVGRPLSILDGVTRLDMTVMCRSNDAIWGAYGANAVHFSVLQEFVARMCGFMVGRMYQLSNNLHAYTPTLEKVGLPECDMTAPGGRMLTSYHSQTPFTPLFRHARDIDVRDALACVDDVWSGLMTNTQTDRVFTLDGLETIVWMRTCYHAYKKRERDRALELAARIPGPDWRRACVEWLERRYSGQRSGAPD